MKRITLSIIVIVIILTFIWFILPKQTHLTLSSPQSDEIYFQEQVEAEDEIEIAWIHSVEHTPWLETLLVSEDGYLTMIETRFQSYGAGTPENTNGSVSVEDGFIVITDINEKYETYNWFHSHDAEFTVSIDDDTRIEPTALPDQTPIEMKVEHLHLFSSLLFNEKG